MRFFALKHKVILINLVAILLLNSCIDLESGDTTTNGNSSTPARFLYTSTNSSDNNEVIRFTTQPDGELTLPARFPTGGVGDSDDGDFDAQGSLLIIDDYLLVVNAGEHRTAAANTDALSATPAGINSRTSRNGTVSVMRIDAEDGSLGDASIFDSYGVRPVSIAYTEFAGTTWVAVGNQYDNPNCTLARLSNPSEICSTLETSVTHRDLRPSPLRNVALFTFDRQTGVLAYVSLLVGDTDFGGGQTGGVTQVAFSPDGTKFALSTWGVPFSQNHTEANIIEGRLGLQNIPNPNGGTLNLPSYRKSTVQVWDTQRSASALTLDNNNKREWSRDGVAGSIGFQWGRSNRYIYQTSFSVPSDSSMSYSVVALDTSGSLLELVDQSGTRGDSSSTFPQSDTIHPDQSCWAWLSPNGNYLYTASYFSNRLSFYRVNGPEDNKIVFSNTYTRKNVYGTDQMPISIPLGDTKDVYIPSNGAFLYVLGAYETHSVSYYAINGDGTLSEHSDSPFMVYTSELNPDPDDEAWLGLVGY